MRDAVVLGLQVCFDHLVLINVHLKLSTGAFLHSTPLGTRLGIELWQRLRGTS